MVMDNLKKAVAKDSSLAKKAASDLEFSPNTSRMQTS